MRRTLPSVLSGLVPPIGPASLQDTPSPGTTTQAGAVANGRRGLSHPTSGPPHAGKPKLATLVLAAPYLALLAGYVDAVGYLSLHAFPANMTGTIVLSGIALADLRLDAAAAHAGAVLALLGGVLAWRGLLRLGQGPAPSLALAALLVAGVAEMHAAGQAALFPLAFAMGMQNAAATRFGGIGLNTSFITGDLERLGETLVDARPFRKRPGAAAVLLPLAVLLAYASGAAGGAVARRVLEQPLLLPALGALIASAWFLSLDLRGQATGLRAAHAPRT